MTTADLNLTDEIEETEDDNACECGICGKAFTWDDGLFTDTCPECEAKQEAIDAAQSEVDETESELESLIDQLKELQEEISEKRAALRNAKKRLARLEA